jgi:hypothetical protein
VKVNRRDVDPFARGVSPPPPPIEPRLSPEEEAALLASTGPGADDAVEARRARVLALLRRPAPLEGKDAELVALLALDADCRSADVRTVSQPVSASVRSAT